MKLNADQQAAANAITGVLVCVAGPGSGKTTVMLDRYKNMITAGIPSSQILNLTFTHAAAAEMLKRSGFLDDKSIFRTFHSFAIDLLKKERANIPFPLCDTIIPVAMEDYQLLFDLVKQFPTITSFRTLQDKISDWKKQNIMPDRAVSEATGLEYFYAMAYQEYERKCRRQGWLDFDSLMQEAVHLLDTNPEVRERHKRKYIAVDECQDTDIVQFRLLQLIFDGNIFVVGDENQLIYEWRSAQSGNLTNFSRLFPGASTMFLGENYRSTRKLVEFFKKILPVDNGIASRMVSNNEEGIDPTFQEFPDNEKEADAILAQITDPAESVIIARTNRQLFLYHKLCTMRSIKYKILGKKDFWDENEVKKLLQIAKNCDDLGPADRVLDRLIRQHNLIELYRNAGRPLEKSPAENLYAVIELAAGKGNIHEFMDFLRKKTHGRKSAKGLTLSTVHQAKGREWNHVFLIGARQGILPHKEGELAEEKRIFFVACSRAAKTLNISYSGPRSMFLNDFVTEIDMHENASEE